MSANWRLGLGTSLMAAAPLLYLFYHFTGNNFSPYWWLPPFGVAIFLSGFFVCEKSDKKKLFKKLELPAKLLAAGTILIWLFYFESDLASVTVDTGIARALAWVAAAASTGILNLAGVSAHLVGQTIVFPPGSKIGGIQVLNACSGIQASTAFLVAYAIVLLDLGSKISKRRLVFLVFLGPAMIYGVNVVRIILLSLIGYFMGYSPLNTAHEYLDFVVFIGETSFFWWLSLRWSRHSTRNTKVLPTGSVGLKYPSSIS
jgi:exosortase/archaeosortase family protein